MNDELEAIADAWNKNTGDGRDRETTVALCDAYVAAHPETYSGLEKFDLPTIVQLLSSRRAAGDEEGAWEIEVWQLHHFEPQNIGGSYEATVRLPNE